MDVSPFQIIFAANSVITALAAIVAMIKAKKSHDGIKHLRIEVNHRLDQLVKASKSEGELKGREDEREDRREDSNVRDNKG